MRQTRIRIDFQDTWHHCYNRIAGTSLDLPFGDEEKEKFVRILKRVSTATLCVSPSTLMVTALLRIPAKSF